MEINLGRMQSALQQIVDHTFHDAVNGREGDEITLTRAQINEIYELARLPLLDEALTPEPKMSTLHFNQPPLLNIDPAALPTCAADLFYSLQVVRDMLQSQGLTEEALKVARAAIERTTA